MNPGTDPVLMIEQPALERLAGLLLERVGLKITPDGFYGLKLALSARMPALGISDGAEYVQRLVGRAGEHELRALLPFVTVGKTDFFRDGDQFRALEVKLIPEMLARARTDGRPVRVWSAGCATGEEPYSVAMTAIEAGAAPQEFDIWATDLNPVAVESARHGIFPHRRLGGVSAARLDRFFRPLSEKAVEIAPEVKSYVRFDGQNLAAPIFPKVPAGSLDLILCRNVIIYFDLPTIRGLMDRFLMALRPRGVLLLGYSESLFRVHNRFEMFEVEGTFVYRRPAGELPPARARVPGEPGPRPTSPERPSRKRPATRQAKAPAPLPPAPPPPPPEPRAPVGPVERLDAVVALMNQGDFEQALSSARRLNENESGGLDALLTLGNIYSLMGKNAESREAFALALSREPLCVEARVFGGIAALQAGALTDAKAELTKALFLEPTLALGHYLLAQVHERAGDHEAARRSYRNAIAQLRFPQRALAGHYPDLPESVDAMGRAARYALAALQER